MTPWKQRLLTVLMLMLVASASVLNLVETAARHTESDLLSPYVLLEETIEEGEAEGADDFLVLPDLSPRIFANAVSYATHIAEECEFDRARKRKAHFWRGPPAV